jgi:SAM-dependent methyltransferase
MNPDVYKLASESEEKHWWFSARRDILRSVLDRFCPRGSPRQLLEVGCGNGGNLPMLAEYGNLWAIEVDDDSRKRASSRGIAKIEKGWLPDGMPFDNASFDVIAALDVLEHVPDDEAAVNALRSALVSKGLLLVTVPAYMWLWSRHDDLTHHKRRYSLKQIENLLKRSGFDVLYSSYFNTLLFPFAVARIKLTDLFDGDPLSAVRIPAPPLNDCLRAIFRCERHLVPRTSLPFGISIVVCGRVQ